MGRCPRRRCVLSRAEFAFVNYCRYKSKMHNDDDEVACAPLRFSFVYVCVYTGLI